jgi:hypothetical protein
MTSKFQVTETFGHYTLIASRVGIRGEYSAVASLLWGSVFETRRYGGPGARSKAMEDVKAWCAAHPNGPLCIRCQEPINNSAIKSVPNGKYHADCWIEKLKEGDRRGVAQGEAKP